MKGNFPVVRAEVWESEMLPVAAISWCNACEEPQRQSRGKGTTEHLTGSSGGRKLVPMGAGSWSFLQSQKELDGAGVGSGYEIWVPQVLPLQHS